MHLKKEIYDRLKFIALIVLPALATLYFTLGGLWNFPYVNQVMGTFTSLGVFLGTLLGLSSRGYYRSDARFGGDISVATDEATGKKTFTLSLNQPPEDLETSQEILFKINPV